MLGIKHYECFKATSLWLNDFQLIMEHSESSEGIVNSYPRLTSYRETFLNEDAEVSMTSINNNSLADTDRNYGLLFSKRKL
jgi:hypothetical protein